MSKVYHFAGLTGTIFRARKTDALRDARQWSRNGSISRVEVGRTEVRDDLPMMILLENALNDKGWRVEGATEIVAAFEKGKAAPLVPKQVAA